MRTAVVAALALTVLALPAHADPKHGGPRVDVPRLAHQIDDTARALHREALRFGHPRDRHGASVRHDFDRLAEAARHYHRQVERRFDDPRHSARDFERLAAAFHDARTAAYRSGSRQLLGGLRGVERPLAVLFDVYRPWLDSHRGYGSGEERGDRHDRYGRYGHGRNGRGDWRDRRDGDRGEWRDGDPGRRHDGYNAFPPAHDRWGRPLQPMGGKADGGGGRDD